jgi:uncharacterized hydrophobic protein (TIGR00271 family)
MLADSAHVDRSGARRVATGGVGDIDPTYQDVDMLHLRLIVPHSLTDVVLQRLNATPGVAHIIRGSGSAIRPGGDVVVCDVAREAANEVVEWLQDQGVHRSGAITVEAVEAVVSDAAAAAETLAPGHGADALVWEELEARTRAEAVLTVSFVALMAIAAIIAAVGILLDSPILVIGAMVVGPEYGPLAALCVALVRGRRSPARVAAVTLGTGLIVAAGAALIATTLFRVTELAPDAYELGERELTAFIAHPDGLAVTVAVLAGIVGMLALTEARSGALVGVLVSVTTIPAASNVGVATAYREWSEVGGAALQLALNVTALVIAGVATLAIQARATARRSA